MDITFTGFKNTSFNQIIQRPIKEIKNGKVLVDNDKIMQVRIINTQLTDDFNGKDLTEYKESLAKSAIAGKFHPNNKDMINIVTVNLDPFSKEDFKVFINKANLNPEDKNLRLFSFVAKLLKRIAKQKPSEFEINKDYLRSEEPALVTTLGVDARDVLKDEDAYLDFLDVAYDPQKIKEMAKAEFFDIHNCMVRYFE
jgi:hypothetical protein